MHLKTLNKAVIKITSHCDRKFMIKNVHGARDGGHAAVTARTILTVITRRTVTVITVIPRSKKSNTQWSVRIVMRNNWRT